MAASRPAPSGNSPFPPPPSTYSRSQQITYYADKLDGIYPGFGYGASYTQYASDHPGESARDALVIWQLDVLTAGLGSSVKSEFTGEGQSIGEIGTGTVKGLAPLGGIAAIGDFFARLVQGNTWKRVAEAGVAIVLLDVGLKAFTGNSVIEKAATKVGPGRAVKVLKK